MIIVLNIRLELELDLLESRVKGADWSGDLYREAQSKLLASTLNSRCDLLTFNFRLVF